MFSLELLTIVLVVVGALGQVAAFGVLLYLLFQSRAILRALHDPNSEALHRYMEPRLLPATITTPALWLVGLVVLTASAYTVMDALVIGRLVEDKFDQIEASVTEGLDDSR